MFQLTLIRADEKKIIWADGFGIQPLNNTVQKFCVSSS